MKHTRKKLICCLIALFMVLGLLPAVPSTVYARSYSEFAPNDLIQLGDNIFFDKMDSFRFRDFEDPTTSHEVKASDFPNHVATLSETEGYYSLGSTRVMPIAASPGGLLVAEYESDTGWITFGRQVPQWYFNEYTGIMEVNGTGVIPSYMFVSGSGSDTYKFYQSNLIRRLEINADHLSVIKTQAFEAYTDGCVLEDIVITSSLPKQLDIEPGAFLYDKEEDPNPVNLTINTLSLDTVRGCPIENYGSPVNLVYNVRHPIVFEKNALAEFDGDYSETMPPG